MIKRLTSCLIVVMAVLFVATNCSAQSQDWNFEQGNREISFTGSFSGMDLTYGSTIQMLSLSGSYGYFLTDASELSFRGTGIWADVDGVDISSTGFGIDYKYHFLMPGLKPYIGFQFMMLSADVDYAGLEGDADGQMYGPLAGIKYFLTESALLTIEGQYQMLGGDLEDVLERSAQISLGMSFLF